MPLHNTRGSTFMHKQEKEETVCHVSTSFIFFWSLLFLWKNISLPLLSKLKLRHRESYTGWQTHHDIDRENTHPCTHTWIGFLLLSVITDGRVVTLFQTKILSNDMGSKTDNVSNVKICGVTKGNINKNSRTKWQVGEERSRTKRGLQFFTVCGQHVDLRW